MIRNFLDLSTAHIKPETRQRFEDGEQLCGPVYPHPEGFGWFVWVGEYGDDATDAPADLVACFNRARKERCEYICFDCDAPMIDQLPIYEDEPPAMTYEAAAAAQAGAQLPVEELRPDLKQISETANDAAPRDPMRHALQKMWDFASIMVDLHGMNGSDTMTDADHKQWQEAAGAASAALANLNEGA